MDFTPEAAGPGSGSGSGNNDTGGGIAALAQQLRSRAHDLLALSPRLRHRRSISASDLPDNQNYIDWSTFNEVRDE